MLASKPTISAVGTRGAAPVRAHLRGTRCGQHVRRAAIAAGAVVVSASFRGRKQLRTVAVAAAPTSNSAGATIPFDQAKITVFSSAQYVLDFLQEPLTATFPNSTFVPVALSAHTAPLAAGSDIICLFVNDTCDAKTVKILADVGVKAIAMRCAGFDRVDLKACVEHGIRVFRVPTYSPQSVAEHAVALMFALNRKLHNSYLRTQQGNYALSGLIGYEMYAKTVGVIGTGAIGVEACRILTGIGCKVLAFDIQPNPKCLDLGVKYLSIDELLPLCDIVTLHCPLLPATRHTINKERVKLLQDNTMLINVSRGGLMDTDALLEGLENGKIGALGMDVYENEGSLFFRDFTSLDSTERMKYWDKKFKELQSYPQVLITPHTAFLTYEALQNISNTTVENLKEFCTGSKLTNEVLPRP